MFSSSSLLWPLRSWWGSRVDRRGRSGSCWNGWWENPSTPCLLSVRRGQIEALALIHIAVIKVHEKCVHCAIGYSPGPLREDPPVQAIAFHHPAEGGAAEEDGRAAGHRRGVALPASPPSGTQAPPPALQTLWLHLHRLVIKAIPQNRPVPI